MKIKELEKKLNAIKDETYEISSGLWDGISIHIVNANHVFYHDRNLGFWEDFYSIKADHFEEIEEEKNKFQLTCSGLKYAVTYIDDDARTAELDIYVSDPEIDFNEEEVKGFIQAVYECLDFFEEEDEKAFIDKYGLKA